MPKKAQYKPPSNPKEATKRLNSLLVKIVNASDNEYSLLLTDYVKEAKLLVKYLDRFIVLTETVTRESNTTNS